jgi:hypothetical protein
MPTLSPDGLIPVTELPREIRGAVDFFDLKREALSRFSYRTWYGFVADRFIPAERKGLSWSLRRKDLPAIVSALGVALKRLGRPRRHAASFNLVTAAT